MRQLLEVESGHFEVRPRYFSFTDPDAALNKDFYIEMYVCENQKW